MCVCTHTRASHSYKSWGSWILIPITVIQSSISRRLYVHKYCKYHTHAHRCSSILGHAQVIPQPSPHPQGRGSVTGQLLYCSWLGGLEREIAPLQPWLHPSSFLDAVPSPSMTLCPTSLTLWTTSYWAFWVFLKGLTPSRHRIPLLVWLQRGVRALREHMPVPASGVMERGHILSRTIILEPEFKR